MPTVTSSPGRVTTRPVLTRELTWRLLRDASHPGAANMALDHALAACLRPEQGVVRLYGWSQPTVSFGKNEPAERLGEGMGPGGVDLDYVRRPTGGRAVLHDQELTYAVVAPLDALGGLREAYLRINEALAEAIRALGAEVDVSPGTETLSLDAGPCFQSPTRGEIVAEGRKLVGSAQARLEGVLLQHGSILLAGDQGLLDEDGTAVTLSELLPEVTPDGVADAVSEALRRSLGGEWADGGYDVRELEYAARLEEERYGSDEWTWRR
jgi:lipoate-protein ligase A